MHWIIYALLFSILFSFASSQECLGTGLICSKLQCWTGICPGISACFGKTWMGVAPRCADANILESASVHVPRNMVHSCPTTGIHRLLVSSFTVSSVNNVSFFSCNSVQQTLTKTAQHNSATLVSTEYYTAIGYGLQTSNKSNHNKNNSSVSQLYTFSEAYLHSWWP